LTLSIKLEMRILKRPGMRHGRLKCFRPHEGRSIDTPSIYAGPKSGAVNREKAASERRGLSISEREGQTLGIPIHPVGPARTDKAQQSSASTAALCDYHQDASSGTGPSFAEVIPGTPISCGGQG
jgi:hypothetical protein